MSRVVILGVDYSPKGSRRVVNASVHARDVSWAKLDAAFPGGSVSPGCPDAVRRGVANMRIWYLPRDPGAVLLADFIPTAQEQRWHALRDLGNALLPLLLIPVFVGGLIVTLIENLATAYVAYGADDEASLSPPATTSKRGERAAGTR